MLNHDKFLRLFKDLLFVSLFYDSSVISNLAGYTIPTLFMDGCRLTECVLDTFSRFLNWVYPKEFVSPPFRKGI